MPIHSKKNSSIHPCTIVVICMPKQNLNLTDADYIFKQALEFLKLTAEGWKAHIQANPMDCFYTIPHPKNGHALIIGAKAFKRFEDIAVRYLKSNPSVKKRSNIHELIEQLRISFSQYFLSGKWQLDQSHVDRWISSASKSIMHKFEALTHYIPCVLFEPVVPKFHIGPVTFSHINEFLKDNQSDIDMLPITLQNRRRAKIEKKIKDGYPADKLVTDTQLSEQSKRIVEMMLNAFRCYNWVAVVAIPKCESDISHERAVFATRGALNIIKLLLGSQYTNHLRIVEDSKRRQVGARLKRKDDGALDLSIEIPIGPEDRTLNGWADILFKNTGKFLPVAGNALRLCTDFDTPPHLCTRFIDALHWYGDAISERSPAAKILKFVTAIERICSTGKEHDANGVERGITNIVTVRASIFYAQAGQKMFEEAKKEINSIYKCRSELVHGSVSPFSESVYSLVAKTNEVAQLVLLAGLDFFYAQGLEDKNIGELELKNFYLALEKKSTSTSHGS